MVVDVRVVPDLRGGGGEGEKRTANQLKDVQNTTVSLLKFDAQDQRFLIPSTFFAILFRKGAKKLTAALEHTYTYKHVG